MLKKSLLAIMVASTLSIGAGALVACNNSSNGDNGGAFALTETKDIYAYSAVSAATVMSNLNKSSAVAASGQVSGENVPSPDYSSYVEAVNGYMAIAENMLSGENFVISEAASDRTDYEYKTVVSYADLMGEKTEYVMYYNKVKQVDRDEDWDDKFDNEEEFNINGVVLMDGVEYEVIGESETEGDESEIELTVRLDRQNFVTVGQEKENDEIEYVYSVWQNGKKVEETSFESETERGKHELTVGILKDGKRQYFTFEEKERGGKKYIQGRIKDEANDFAFEIIVKQNANTGEYIYEYKFNEKTYDKKRK
ncbi:MAG: hypothetical protein J6B04_03795 [Clostridia bacterium]|nr:hypothetical protein [Clostridia bacterium]